MRFIHFSQDPQLSLSQLLPYDDRIYQQSQSWSEARPDWKTWHKPRGAIWVSDEDARTTWATYWAELEDVSTRCRGDHAYEVTFWDTPRLLLIDDYWKFLEFEKRFAVASQWNDGFLWEECEENHIAWGSVDEEYDAVLITPYQHGFHAHNHWYYAWNCASGPILHPRVIKSWEKVDESDFPKDNAAGSSVRQQASENSPSW